MCVWHPVQKIVAVLVSVTALLAPTAWADDMLRVSSDFPGGAAEVLDINQQQRRIRFQVPETKTEALRSWWYMHVTGIRPNEELQLELVFGKAKARRASFSEDHVKWRLTAPATIDEATDSYLYRQKITGREAWFAWYMPYLSAQADDLTTRAAKQCAHAEKFVLCDSEGGRPIYAIRFSEPGVEAKNRFGVWIQARQHAWETGGSWAAHGLVEWLSSTEPAAIELRRKATITVIPIMDVDSVERGLGGKWQTPHDHNRDWSSKPHWRAVQAAQQELKRLDCNRQLDLVLDLHDPSWEGEFEFWCNPYPQMKGIRRRNTDRFLAAAKTEIVGPLKFDPTVYSPYTLDTPTAGNWSSMKTRSHVVGGTCEIGVCPPAGFTGEPPSFQLQAGKELGLAINRYLSIKNRMDD